MLPYGTTRNGRVVHQRYSDQATCEHSVFVQCTSQQGIASDRALRPLDIQIVNVAGICAPGLETKQRRAKPPIYALCSPSKRKKLTKGDSLSPSALRISCANTPPMTAQDGLKSAVAVAQSILHGYISSLTTG